MPDGSSPKISAGPAAAAGLMGGAGLVAAVTLFQGNLLVFIGLLGALLTLLLGGYLAFVKIKKRKRSQLFSEGMKSSGSTAPRNVSDPNKLRRLEELRQKFEEGLQAYRSRGKDLYTLPWYIIVGEPGGGKSEAIRHSNIGFPPGLQDELQGVGGTINMSWWFSDQAVLLDTAGRLIFEEAPPGESSEWKEFLNLLKTARPNCPINGLLLVIPCDSLIKDSEAELERKARKLAEQLDTIQRVLDVRFPVSILVTKCDLLVGFREYFEDIKDPRLQHQIFGWSNPDKLDSPFRPHEVDRYLDEVGHRLGRRRLQLLRDPAPEGNPQTARRADEVDTLYALPHRLEAIAPRLRRYLEACFQQGAWSLPPLFLRGIYFSSALREGAPLDAELAAALGMPVESVGDFKFLEREKSFFLKDLFVEKVFKERGLVTRATNTRQVLRRRKFWMYGGASAALGLFLLFAWLGMRSFKMSIAAQSEAWRPVAEKGWVGSIFADSLVPASADGVYQPVTDVQKFNDHQTDLGIFHAKLREQSTNAVKLDFISRVFFGRLAARYEKESLDGQRIVFETSVVKPLVESARQKTASQVPANMKEADAHAEALAALLQLEGSILSRWSGTNFGRPTPGAIQALADPLLTFVAGAPLDTNLLETWTWLYNSNDATLASGGRGSWPPQWLSDYVSGQPQDLRGYPNLNEGLLFLYRGVTNSLTDQVKDWAIVSELYNSLRALRDEEQQMIAATRAGQYPQAETHRVKYIELASALEVWMREHRGANLFQGEISLVKAQENFQRAASGSSMGPLSKVDQACSNLLARQDHKLFSDVRRELSAYQTNVSAAASRLVQAIPETEIKALESYLVAIADRGPALLARRDILQALKSLDDIPLPPAGQKIGREGFFLQKLDQAAADLAPTVGERSGLPQNFRDAATWLLQQRADRRAGDFLQAYLAEAQGQLAPAGYWPLGRDNSRYLSAAEVFTVRRMLERIDGDLAAPSFEKRLANPGPDWKAFKDRMEILQRDASILVDENGVPPRVKITILAYDDSNDADAWRRTWEFARAWDGGEAPRIGNRSIEPKDLGTIPIDREMEIRCFVRDELKQQQKDIIFKTPPWGALHLMQQAGTTIPTGSSGIWEVNWPIENAPVTGKLRLRMQWLGSAEHMPGKAGRVQ